MKQCFISMMVLFISINCFANTGSSSLQNQLGSAWKTEKSIHPKSDKNDILMGYGGEDLRPKTILMGQDSLA